MRFRPESLELSSRTSISGISNAGSGPVCTTALLANVGEGLSVCGEAPWAKSIYHLYVVRVQDRDELMAKLAHEDIGTGIHYPVPLHLQRAYRHLGYKEGDFPISERLAKEIVSLPMYPNLTPEQQHRVVEKIREFLTRPRGRDSVGRLFDRGRSLYQASSRCTWSLLLTTKRNTVGIMASKIFP